MTGVSGLLSMTLAEGSGMISEWLTDPDMLVVRQPLPPPADGTPHVPGMVPPLPPGCWGVAAPGDRCLWLVVDDPCWWYRNDLGVVDRP